MYFRTIVWDTPQRGPVGRFSNGRFRPFLKNFSLLALVILQQQNQIITIFQESLQGATDYNKICLQLGKMHFRQIRTVVLNMDNADLKRNFISIMHGDL